MGAILFPGFVKYRELLDGKGIMSCESPPFSLSHLLTGG